MITETGMYWFTRLDSVSQFIGFCTGAFLVLTILFFIASAAVAVECTKEEKDKYFGKLAKATVWCFAGVLLTIIFNVLLPSENEMAAIYLVPALANNKMVQQIPQNAATLLNDKLKDWIKNEDKK